MHNSVIAEGGGRGRVGEAAVGVPEAGRWVAVGWDKVRALCWVACTECAAVCC
jgi:hypothetical protein